MQNLSLFFPLFFLNWTSAFYATLFIFTLGCVLLGSTGFGWFGWLSFFVFYWEKTVFGWFGWSTFSTSSELGWNGWKRWIASADLLASTSFHALHLCFCVPWNCSSVHVVTVKLSTNNNGALFKWRFSAPWDERGFSLDTVTNMIKTSKNMLLNNLIQRSIHNVAEPILLTVLERQPK